MLCQIIYRDVFCDMNKYFLAVCGTHSPGLLPFRENVKLFFFSRKYGQKSGCGLFTSAAYARTNAVKVTRIKNKCGMRHALARPFALSRKREIIFFFKKIWSKVGVRLIHECSLCTYECGKGHENQE